MSTLKTHTTSVKTIMYYYIGKPHVNYVSQSSFLSGYIMFIHKDLKFWPLTFTKLWKKVHFTRLFYHAYICSSFNIQVLEIQRILKIHYFALCWLQIIIDPTQNITAFTHYMEVTYTIWELQRFPILRNCVYNLHIHTCTPLWLHRFLLKSKPKMDIRKTCTFGKCCVVIYI